MTRVRPLAAASLLILTMAAPARADVTAFIGANMTPDNRQARGAAFGIGLLVIGFEGEYSFTPDDPLATAPALWTGMGNLLLQSPVPFFGFQPYFTTGGGFYHESLGLHSSTGVALNTGGGVKMNLVGPLRLRIDYRIFKLGSSALYSPAHRLYAGINIKF